jgi:hypothetical protein
MAFFNNLGFDAHPFVKTNADEEENLQEYFVPPPFFDAVIGDKNSPSPCIVLAPRGAGKTAQRIMVEKWSNKNQVLAISYDRFEFAKGQQLKDISLSYHCRNIIIRILVSYLSYLSDYPDLIKNLNSNLKKTLSIFAHSYLGNITGNELQNILSELKSLPEKFKDFWKKNVGVLEPLLNLLLKKYGIESIDIPEIQQEQKKLSETYKHQLEILLELIGKIGFKSIYILVDKVDESEKTGNDSAKTYDLIQPMLKDLEFLGLKGYGFKFFVWDKIEPLFRTESRPDRVPQYQLQWSRSLLENMLSKRLSAFSKGRIKCFKQIVDSSVSYNIDSALCIMSNGSPRNLIRLCEKIISSQAEIDNCATLISSTAINKATIDFSLQLSIELYGNDIVRDLQHVGRELFTINYLANDIFKLSHENTSRNKVAAWENNGLIRQIGSVHLERGKRPANFYYVCDPSVIRLQQRSVNFDVFFKDRWINCTKCNIDNLMDVALFPIDNNPICINCGASLF